MIPFRLVDRLHKIGLDESIYDKRTRKCILSKKKMNMEVVPWYEHAYFIDDKFKKKDEFVFDPVSIVPCLALNPQKEEKILDMCAAPGTKTFILSFLTDNEAHIIANDIDKYRVKRLKANVTRFSLSCEVLNLSGRLLEGEYDKILLDAPCSGEGMINKKEKVFEYWSEKRMKLLAKKQKKLIVRAFELLKKGGTLVYSTCTFNVEENEEIVNFLLGKFDNAKIEDIDVNIKHEDGIIVYDGKVFNPDIKKCYRIYPSHNNTGGFFVAKITKT
ncbi:MAG: RsmB/NOP family class I SAM-dependent RNA methyltransferase [Candidatus Aenigmarchaeota archaeon]|nr:RsmB/NOP family class I SAM-dependent RNA methyltransferase [Candidatus Aenigmarchaeota archaeon]